ncbi:rod shape-determining protein RodA [Desulforamulus hydrothermalis]|uniref:Peptidoglycan glycosyltransferase RodA n=1 Tax=Desulforamulus hydrothermalis Lam5 = DSM 18033 TaxID=1121428 RepID=K8DY60_9FIRM|nr:rod shape-determining protein RodA [Desulforamulus hydrothermalis]CCO07684.1 Stage V sporulation protein E [Desulforamulus hydrothermalis Lam5 = DSM 18033]SHH25295.1 rod shape determining protein RodA [Desulforamulus hydrothermalis Lam5 = DSM 18033]
MVEKRLLKNLDYILLTAVILIICFSLVIISSATLVNSPMDYRQQQELWSKDIQGLNGETPSEPLGTVIIKYAKLFFSSFVKKQILFVFIGLLVMVFIMSVPYEDLRRHRKAIYILNLLLLLVVLSPLGHSAKGATRWINLGPFLLQPSEFAKIFIIITFADFLTRREGKLNTLKDFIPCFVHVGVPMLLILKQPDLGTSLVFIGIMFAMLFVAGANSKLVAGLFVGGWAFAVAWVWMHFKFGLWIPLKEYQLDRLLVFIDPWKQWHGAGYHVVQSQIAIGSGGLEGKGIYNGSQNQLNFLPEQHTDFIFSVVGEEMGFIGVTALLILFFILLYRGIRIAAQARDLYGTLLATGIVAMISFHILVNVGMVSGIMPVTGVPLPLFSYGGSSMMTNMIAVGILLNVYMRRQKILF